MIVDVCIINTEEFHLQCRIAELEGVVDRFVVIEGNRTFQGAQKPFYFEGKEDKYRKHGVDFIRADLTWIDDVPDQSHQPWVNPQSNQMWMRDWKQRNAFKTDDYPEDTVFIFSDADEIPKRETVEAFDGVASVLMQTHLIYSTKYTTGTPWAGSVIGLRKDVKTFPRARNERWKFRAMSEGGWHMGWFGGELSIQKKLREYSHVELMPHAKEIAEVYPRKHIRPAGGSLLEPYDGELPEWVEEGNAPNSWYLEW